MNPYGVLEPVEHPKSRGKMRNATLNKRQCNQCVFRAFSSLDATRDLNEPHWTKNVSMKSKPGPLRFFTRVMHPSTSCKQTEKLAHSAKTNSTSVILTTSFLNAGWHRWFGICRLGSFAWNRSLGNFRLGSAEWDLSFGISRLRS